MLDVIMSFVPGPETVAVLMLKGVLNAETYELLQQKAQWAIERGSQRLVLDMGDVSYMSSSGIRAINHIFHALRTDLPQDSDAAIREGMRAGTYRSPHLKLARPQPRVHEVLKLSGVNQFLEIHEDVPKAIDSFKRGS